MRLIATICALLAAMPASAATYMVSITGVVREGSVFGAGGDPIASLTGQAVSASYTVNDGIPGIIVQSYDDGSVRSSGVDGGSVFGVPSPVNAALTLGTTQFSIAGNDRGYFNVYRDLANANNDGIGVSVSSNVIDDMGQRSGILDFVVYSAPQGTTSGDYRVPFSRIFQPGDSARGIFDYDITTFDAFGGATSVTRYRAEIEPLTITVTKLAAVPEPAAWAMMIGGFGAMGASMRRRKRTAVALA